ncbi:MAG: dihydroorotate dehydrogenase electron transfer subunit [Thermoproteota archaeon]
MNSIRPLDSPRRVEVLANEQEGTNIWRIEFQDKQASLATPGQFIMVYVPGFDEIPISVADIEGTVIKIAVKALGECTEALSKKKKGDLIGVRGPYGNGFKLFGGRVLLVGGGTGTAPLLLLAKRLSNSCSEITSIIGATTGEQLLFCKALSKYCKVKPVTEDGSVGEKGMAYDLAKNEILSGRFDYVYACGPEPMMVKLVELCLKERVQIQCSLERWFKCGVGLCGSCVLDDLGLRVCTDGPVFSGDQLARVSDFGRYYRNASGSKVPF